MLSSVSLARLVEDSACQKVLAGTLLPTNNNAAFITTNDITTVTLVDTDGKTPVAFMAAHMPSPRQVYCMVGEVSKKYRGTTIWIEELESDNKKAKVLKVTDFVEGKLDHTGLGLFVATFGEHDGRPIEEYLMQTLIDNTVGNVRVEQCKNLTIDILGDQDLSGWRDNAGFVVSDMRRFFEITVDRLALAELSTGSSYSVEPLSKNNISIVLDYEDNMTTFNRQDYLIALTKLSGVKGFVCTKDGLPIGYILTLGSRILSCYADDQDICKLLLSSAAAELPEGEEVTMFAMRDSSEFTDNLIDNATSITRVNRLHTRVLINQVKWSKVFIPNVGLNVF